MEQPLVYKSNDVLSGTPVFYGTRVPVHNLVDYLSAGETIETFLENFPTVRREQVVQFLQENKRLSRTNFDFNENHGL